MKDEYDFSKGKRGTVITRDPNKARITIRLDADIIDYFKTQVHKPLILNPYFNKQSSLRFLRRSWTHLIIK